MINKCCKYCNIDKQINKFVFLKKQNKYRPICKSCVNSKKREYAKKMTVEQKEKENLSKLNWAKKNKEKVILARNKYKNNNHGKIKLGRSRAKDKIKQATPKWLTKEQKFAMECFYTMASIKSAIGEKYEVDHIIPINGKNVCGLNVPWNLETLKASENRKKRNDFNWWRTGMKYSGDIK